MDAIEIGKKLTKLRGNKPQAVVAKDVGISVSALSMYEQGNRVPKDTIKIRLAHYYGTSIEALFYVK